MIECGRLCRATTAQKLGFKTAALLILNNPYGIGLGDSSVETMGLKPARLGEFERTIQEMRDLLAGKEVALESGRIHLKHPAKTRIPIYIAASGPKMLELAGKIADGVIILVGIADDYIRQAVEKIQAGAESAGVRPLAAEADAQRTPITQPFLMHTLGSLVPADAVIVDESATSLGHVLRYLPLSAPDSFFGGKTGTLGWGMGAAIGVQLAYPHRKVVATTRGRPARAIACRSGSSPRSARRCTRSTRGSRSA